MRRGYAIGLLFLAACSSSRTWTTGGRTNEELRTILERRTGSEAGLATPGALYLIPATHLAAEKDALGKAMHDAPVEEEAPGVIGFNSTGVVAWSRPEVFELAFEDGTLHVEWEAGRPCHVAFERGKDVLYMDLAPSASVDAAWRALVDATRRASTGTRRRGGAGVRPLAWMRGVGIDSRGP
jgi:hypothetical protein